MTVPVHGLPPVLGVGMHVYPVPPRLRGARCIEVTSADAGPTGTLVSFDGVRDISAAKELVGLTLLVPEEELPADFSMHDRERLLGRAVVDRTLGEVGTIVEVLVNPAQDVWVCEGAYGEVLVPAVEGIVVELEEDGPIVVELPAGLVGGA